MKLVRILFLGILCAFVLPCAAQLNIGTVDPGPYTPGSSIATTFTINPASCIAQGNVFTVFLSDATGSFATETPIGTYNSFYSTFVNGTIPAAATPSTNYRVRVKSNAPVYTSAPSAPFEIRAGATVQAGVSSIPINPASPETYGLCSGRAANNFGLTNTSTATSTVTATITNELSGGAPTAINFNTPAKVFTADLAHYTIFAKAVMPDGRVSTKAYFLINNKTVTAFSTSSGDVKCLPTDPLVFNVITTTSDGIQNNFPGNTYVVNWGDQTTSTYTLCDIIQSAGKVQHIYTQSSCGNVFNSSAGPEYNVFAINIGVENPFCGRVGSSISSTAKVVARPINSFTATPTACTNSLVTFNNTSILGENPIANAPGCEPNAMFYNWYVDGVLIEANRPRSYNFEYTFTTHGVHNITLESINTSGNCNGDPVTFPICVQDPPQPIFSLTKTTICSPDIIKAINTSIIDNICSAGNTYVWAVTGGSGYTFVNGTTAISAEPEIRFTAGGIYQIRLSVTTASCGTVTSAPQQIVVNETPTAALSADAALCSVNTYDFNPTTTGPTRTLFTGTALDLSDTYTWTITGGTYNFIGGDLHTKYPTIQFLDYVTYTITATHKNTCGTVTDTQIISFTPAPTVNSGPDQNICYNEPNVTLAGSITGAVTSQTWVGGGGSFTPNRNTLNATYIPTTAERNAGIVTLTLRATTTLPAPCNQIDNDIIINIKPRITVNSVTTKSICTGTNVAYTPTSASGATTTFTWTATGTPNAAGFTASGNGNITDVLTNSDPTLNAVVTYLIIPSYDGCTGDPFNLVVTVTPNPILTATPANSTICSGQTTAINLASNLGPTTKYTWTSIATVGLTGNSSNTTAATATSINDQIFNSGTTAGTVTYTILPFSANNCPGDPVQVVINVEPLPSAPNAGVDQRLCQLNSTTLDGNLPTVGTGLWTQVTSIVGVNFADATLHNTIVSGLQAGNTYVFRWTITGAASCTPRADEVTVIIDPLSVGGTTAGSTSVCAGTNSGQITLSGNVGNVLNWQSSLDGITWTDIAETSTTLTYNNLVATTQFRAVVQSGSCASSISTPSTITVNQQVGIASAGTNQILCNATSTTLDGNIPTAPNTGLWTVTSGQLGVTFNDPSFPKAIVSGLVPGQTYTFTWTISGLAPCPPSTSNVTVQVDLPSIGGTAGGSTSVCAGSNSGNITLTGNVGSILRWASSTDGGITWLPIANTTATLAFLNLTTTTQYRAEVKNGTVCAATFSTIATVTVNQPVGTATAGANQILCNANSTILDGNIPTAPNTGLWTVTAGPAGVTFNNPSFPKAIVSGLIPGQTYTFTWTISGLAPCPPSTSNMTVQVDLPSNGGAAGGSTTVCAGSNSGNITLTGNVGTILSWASSTDGGVTWLPIVNTTSIISYLNLSTTTQYRAEVRNGTVCASAFSTIATVTVNQGAIGATVGPNQTLCNSTSATLTGNSPLTNTGLWTQISGPVGATITDPALYNSTVTGLIGGGTYVFLWTISGLPPCPSTSAQLTIVNLPELQNNTISTPITTNCNGQVITLTGSTPTGGDNTYIYNWESSPTGAAPWTVITGQTGINLNVTVNASLSYRRTVTSGVCSTFSNVITITALPSIATNTISATQTICLTNTPNPIIGSSPTGGDGTNYTYSWEQSIDNGTTWAFVPGANAKDYAPPAITQTTLYRRLVSSGVCAGAQQSISNVVTITVNLNARAEFTWITDLSCTPFELNATNIKAVPYPSQNATYTWYADNVIIGNTINFPTYTINTANTTVEIKLVTTSSSGCAPSTFIHSFRTRVNIQAAFTTSVTEGCGPLPVNFTNTTVDDPSNTYQWSIDGISISTSKNLPSQSFDPDPLGFDKKYDITLTVSSICGITSITHSVIVRAIPLPAISAVKSSGCSTFRAEFINTSPGKGNNTYVINFGDGSAPQSYAFGDPIFHDYNTTTVTDFAITMTATNACTSITSEPIYVRVTPNDIIPIFFAPPADETVCAGTEIIFRNNTAGASRFEYDFKDGSAIVPRSTGLPESIRHTFTQPGVYDVTMTAFNSCASPKSAIQRITVLARPTATFSANLTVGCKGLVTTFTQVSTGAIRYDWDFGDGFTSTAPNPTHTYNAAPGSYNVTLTVTNSLGCANTITLPNYIRIVAPPIADFNIAPAAVVSIPTYTFNFNDASTNGAQTYKWSFGDGDISSLKNPTHKYTDTGKYLVTMRTYNEYGCVDSLQKSVQIVGVPGYVYLPNSFIPGGTSSPLQKFMAVGSGIKSWHMSIFNKWGQVVWETTKLDDGKPVEGWDGTYKGVAQPQGIYFWKLEVELINGTEWKGMTYNNKPPKRTGEIYLIR